MTCFAVNTFFRLQVSWLVLSSSQTMESVVILILEAAAWRICMFCSSLSPDQPENHLGALLKSAAS